MRRWWRRCAAWPAAPEFGGGCQHGCGGGWSSGALCSAIDAAVGVRAGSCCLRVRPAWARPRSPRRRCPTQTRGAAAVWGTCWEGVHVLGRFGDVGQAHPVGIAARSGPRGPAWGALAATRPGRWSSGELAGRIPRRAGSSRTARPRGAVALPRTVGRTNGGAFGRSVCCNLGDGKPEPPDGIERGAVAVAAHDQPGAASSPGPAGGPVPGSPDRRCSMNRSRRPGTTPGEAPAVPGAGRRHRTGPGWRPPRRSCGRRRAGPRLARAGSGRTGAAPPALQAAQHRGVRLGYRQRPDRRAVAGQVRPGPAADLEHVAACSGEQPLPEDAQPGLLGLGHWRSYVRARALSAGSWFPHFVALEIADSANVMARPGPRMRRTPHLPVLPLPGAD